MLGSDDIFRMLYCQKQQCHCRLMLGPSTAPASPKEQEEQTPKPVCSCVLWKFSSQRSPGKQLCSHGDLTARSWRVRSHGLSGARLVGCYESEWQPAQRYRVLRWSWCPWDMKGVEWQVPGHRQEWHVGREVEFWPIHPNTYLIGMENRTEWGGGKS